MRDERWEAVWELFNSAYDKPPGQRSALLASDDLDPDVRSEVLALLEVSSSFPAEPGLPAPPAPGPEYPGGHEFGRYMIVGLIGQGGFGRIYAAHDRDLRRVVALKVLAGPMVTDRDRLMEEARAASAFNHPNVVTVYETIVADGHLAIVMEFVDGQSLRRLMHDSAAPLPIEKVVRYGRQMAEALCAAHAAGITHGDVKPENILVRKDEYIKLVDFGLARSVIGTSPGAGAGVFAGTLRYLSPEQLRGEASSQASDVFSLGLVLYEMTTGVHAFEGKSPLDTAGAIATRQPVHPSRKGHQIPAELDRLTMAMLEKNPAARPATAEVVRALEQIGSESTRWSHRRKSWLAVAAVAVAGVATFVMLESARKPPSIALRLETRLLTGEEGKETQPALSPDGQFVVYRWQSTAAGKPVTLVREIGSEGKTILPIAAPFSWLPDSRHIGFVRHGKNEDTLCTINRDGTGEQAVLKAANVISAKWSPDGDRIVYVAGTGKSPPALFLYSTGTRETRQLTFPPGSIRGDLQFAISHDGKQVAFRRASDPLNSDVFLIDLAVSGSPRQITFLRAPGDDLAWINGGKAIVSSTLFGSNFSLWLHPFTSAQEPRRLTEFGLEATAVQSAVNRNRMVWVSALDDANIWNVPLRGGTPRRVISSAIRDQDVASSSLGLLAFRSDRTGAPEIWISTKDGGSQKKVTNLNSRSGSPRWSPDGRRLVFDSRRNGASDIYVMDCDPEELKCSPPVPLTDHPGPDAIPNWSADGSSVYFASQRSGQYQVWRVPAKGGILEATQMTTKGGNFATESPDGRWLYYSRIDSDQVTGVWRKAAPGNSAFDPDDAGEMLLPLEYRATATWLLSGQEIIYSTFGDTSTPSAVWAFDLTTRRTRLIHNTGAVPLARGLALAPGGKSVFFAQIDRWQSNIVVADYEVVK